MNSRRAMWMALPAVVAVSGAWPASAETYLNESQALAVVFGKNANVKREQQTLDAAKRGQLQRASGLQFLEGSYTFFVNEQSGHPNEFAVVLNEIGKSEPITFMVGMSADGKITDVAIMVFRENRGWEVKEKRFLTQFHGKSLRNSIRVDEDIINYTGATLEFKGYRPRSKTRPFASGHLLSTRKPECSQAIRPIGYAILPVAIDDTLRRTRDDRSLSAKAFSYGHRLRNSRLESLFASHSAGIQRRVCGNRTA